VRLETASAGVAGGDDFEALVARRARRAEISRNYRKRRRQQREAVNGGGEPEPVRRRGGLALRPCRECGKDFVPNTPSGELCSDDCRAASQRRLAVARRGRGLASREAWPAEIDQLASNLARLEEAIDVERDRDRIPLLRRRLLTGTARLEAMKASVLTAEQPASPQ
jgi:hypothetical protein